MNPLVQKVSQHIDTYSNDIISKTIEFVKIPSVKPEKPINGNPLGPDIIKALEFIGHCTEKLNLSFRTIDNQVGIIEYGDADESLGFLLHIDVVPPGDGWDEKPFSGKLKDGYLWGRGSIDDKSAGISTLYALYTLKMMNIPLKKKIILIFGTDEETGDWNGIKTFLNHEKAPDINIVPDSTFPITNGEKGFSNVQIYAKNNEISSGEYVLKSLEGGTRANIVPDKCVAYLCTEKENAIDEINTIIKKFKDVNLDLNAEVGFALDYNDTQNLTSANPNDIVITTKGFAAHSSEPQKGINAIIHMIHILTHLNLGQNNAVTLIQFLHRTIGLDMFGEGLNIYEDHPFLGTTTVSIGTISCSENDAEAVFNIRFPLPMTKEILFQRLNDTVNTFCVDNNVNIQLEMSAHTLDPLFVSPESDFLKDLAFAYSLATGQKADFKSIGGTTYAKSMPNSVSFGPLMENELSLAHQPNERILTSSIIRNTVIFSIVMIYLAGQVENIQLNI